MGRSLTSFSYSLFCSVQFFITFFFFFSKGYTSNQLFPKLQHPFRFSTLIPNKSCLSACCVLKLVFTPFAFFFASKRSHKFNNCSFILFYTPFSKHNNINPLQNPSNLHRSSLYLSPWVQLNWLSESDRQIRSQTIDSLCVIFFPSSFSYQERFQVVFTPLLHTPPVCIYACAFRAVLVEVWG